MLFLLAVAPVICLFSGLAMATVLVVLAVGLLYDGGWQDWKPPYQPPPWAYPLVLLGLWALISTLWSTSGTAFAAKGVGQTWGAILCGAVVWQACDRLDDAGRQHYLRWLAVSLAVAASVIVPVGLGGRLAHDFTLGGVKLYDWSTHLDRPLSLVVVLLWPALQGLLARGKKRYAALLWAITLAAVIAGPSLAAKIALIFGTGLWALTLLNERLGRWALILVGLVVFLLSPVVFHFIPAPEQVATWEFLPGSSMHRLIIWGFVDGKIAEHPVLGWGYESARTLSDHAKFFVQTPSGGVIESEYLPLHPHNGTMQLWLELGGVGIALLCAAWVLGIAALARQTAAAYGFAGLISVLVIANVSFGVWQSWWLSVIAMSFAWGHMTQTKKVEA